MKRRNILEMALLWGGASWVSRASAHAMKTQPWSVRMADADIQRNPEAWMLDFAKKPFWGYCQGLVCLSLLKLWQQNGDEKYYTYVKKYADDLISADGTISTYDKEKYNIDAINAGKILFAIYEKTKESKYEKAIQTLRNQMKTHPRTSEGGFWHKKHYPHQMWLDGLYMATPFLAQYAQFFNETALFDDVALQIQLIDKHNKDEKTGLYSHGWDESKQEKWADKQTGKSAHTWGRGMGWYVMTLIDSLVFFPKNHPQYSAIVAITQQAAQTLIRYQEAESGLWYQVMDVGKSEGNYVEASASTMFVYFLIKSVNEGILDKKYLAAARKGYEGILTHLIKTDTEGRISIIDTCAGAGLGGTPYRDGSYEYYCKEAKRDNDPKAVGPFILLALEFEKRKK